MFSLNVNFKYCKFPHWFDTDELYTCTNDEKCCDVGCCIYTTYKFYKFWYYWLILFVVFGIFSACSWFCKKSTEQIATRRRRNFTYSDGPNEINARRDCYPGCINYLNDLEDVDSQIVLDQLVASFRNRNNTTGSSNLSQLPPPDYDSLTKKLSKESNMYYGPPPRYSSIYKFPPINVHQQNFDVSNNTRVNENDVGLDNANSNAIADVEVHRRINENNEEN